MNVMALCQKMAVLFFCILVGFLAAKGGVLDAEGNKKLSSLVVNVTNPMQIVASALVGGTLMPRTQLLRLCGLIVLMYVVLIGLSRAIPRLLRTDPAHSGVYRFMFILGNTGFLGYPVVESLLGVEASFYVTLFVLVFQFVCWSYGVSLIRGEARFRFHWNVLLRPCVVAALISFVIRLIGLEAPALVYQAFDTIGDLTSPLVMFILGCSLAQLRFGQIFGNWRIYVLIVLKMLLMPLLAFFALRHVLTDQTALCVMTVILCMPVASNTTLISCQYGADETVASSGVFVSTLVCLVSVPAMVSLLFG